MDYDLIEKRARGRQIGYLAAIGLVLVLWAIIVLFPFYWMLLTSVKSYGSYSSEAQTDPVGPTSSGWGRVRRGGCWYGIGQYCRSSARGSSSPGLRYGYLGLRLVLSE